MQLSKRHRACLADISINRTTVILQLELVCVVRTGVFNTPCSFLSQIKREPSLRRETWECCNIPSFTQSVHSRFRFSLARCVSVKCIRTRAEREFGAPGGDEIVEGAALRWGKVKYGVCAPHPRDIGHRISDKLNRCTPRVLI